MYCEECGTKNVEGAKFCEACGAKMAIQAPNPTVTEQKKSRAKNHGTREVRTNKN